MSEMKRWSAKRKQEVVLRVLRGEGLGELSRETRQSAYALLERRDTFLESGLLGLKQRSSDSRAEVLEKERKALQARVGDVIGLHAARPGTRYGALEPIHQGIREHFGGLEQGVATGLVLRHDNEPQYGSSYLQNALAFLCMESTPSFLRAPQGNGSAERFIRTLKEHWRWVRRFESVEDLGREVLAFKDRFNRHWLLQRHGHHTPAQVREARWPNLAIAA